MIVSATWPLVRASALFLLLGTANEGWAERITDIEYGVAGGASLQLDASMPEAAGSFPVALIIHGGGWSSGDKADPFSLLAQSLLSSNFACFSINYRLAPTNRWPACFEDVQTAIRWAKARARDYKGDPQRIALIGYSAGGHLASLAAVRAQEDTRVQAVVGFAPPTDLEADCERRGGLSPSLQQLLKLPAALNPEARSVLRELSPINHLKPGLPPFLLVHGTEDKSVPYTQSVTLQQRLQKLKVPCELVTIAGAPHDVKKWSSLDSEHPGKLLDWLNRILTPAVDAPQKAAPAAAPPR